MCESRLSQDECDFLRSASKKAFHRLQSQETFESRNFYIRLDSSYSKAYAQKLRVLISEFDGCCSLTLKPNLTSIIIGSEDLLRANGPIKHKLTYRNLPKQQREKADREFQSLIDQCQGVEQAYLIENYKEQRAIYECIKLNPEKDFILCTEFEFLLRRKEASLLKFHQFKGLPEPDKPDNYNQCFSVSRLPELPLFGFTTDAGKKEVKELEKQKKRSSGSGILESSRSITVRRISDNEYHVFRLDHDGLVDIHKFVHDIPIGIPILLDGGEALYATSKRETIIKQHSRRQYKLQFPYFDITMPIPEPMPNINSHSCLVCMDKFSDFIEHINCETHDKNR